MSEANPQPFLDRRRVLGCAALMGVAGPLLAACGSGGEPDAAASSTPAGSGSGGAGSDALVATKDVPVGGGVVLDDQGVVVTQPAAGEFKGFSNICTHQGNKVSSVSNGVITCPFHGSQFDITTGDNVTGPNGEAAGTVPPLPAVAVKVSGNEVVRA